MISIIGKCRLEEALVLFKELINRFGGKLECCVITKIFEKKEITDKGECKIISRTDNVNPGIAIDENNYETNPYSIKPKPKKYAN